MKPIWDGLYSTNNIRGSITTFKNRVFFRFKIALVIVLAVYGSAMMGWIEL